MGREDPLEEGVAIHSSILAWRIPWTEEPGGLQSEGLQRVRHDWATNTFNRYCVGFKVNQELVQTVLVCLFKINLFTWYTHLLRDETRFCGRQKRGMRSVCPLDSCLHHLCTTSSLYTSGPQSFWLRGRQFFMDLCREMISGWFKCMTFIVHVIIIPPAPPQIIRC